MIFFSKKTHIPILIICLYTFFALVANMSSAFYISTIILLAATPLFCSTDDTIGIYLYGVCFAGCFAQQDGIFLAGSTLGLIVLVIKLLIPQFKTNFKHNIPLFILIVFYLAEAVYGIISPFSSWGIYRFTNLIAYISIFYLCRKSLNLKSLIKYLFVGVLLSIPMSFLYFTGLSAPRPYIEGSFLRFGGCLLNVNSLGMYCSVGLASSIALCFYGELSKKQFAIYGSIFMLFGIATFSKTFILISLCTLSLSYAYMFVHCQSKKKMAVCTLVGLLCIIVITCIFNEFTEVIVDRFIGNGTSVNGITTGRTAIWEAYLDCWLESPRTILFGYGAFHPYLVLPTGHSPHSIFVGLLVQIGVVGCVALLTILILLVKNNGKLTSRLYLYIPLVVCLLNGLTEDYQNSIHTCIPILLALSFMFEKKHLRR